MSPPPRPPLRFVVLPFPPSSSLRSSRRSCAHRGSLPSSTTVVVATTSRSLFISERSCRWWSRNFRESFLGAPFPCRPHRPPPRRPTAAALPSFPLISHLRPSQRRGPKKGGRQWKFDEDWGRADGRVRGRGATRVACVRRVPLPLLSRLPRS